MVNVSKGLVLANFVLALGFLGAAIMVRGTRQDLDGQLKKQQELVRAFEGKYKYHIDRQGSATKIDARVGMERDFDLAEQNRIQETQKHEKRTREKRDELKQQGDAIVKVHDANQKAIEETLNNSLEKLKTTRETAEAKAKLRDQKAKAIAEAEKLKFDLGNEKAQLDLQLQVLRERAAEAARRLKAAEKAVGGGSA